MFRKNDHIPFLCGIFILGGLVVVPIVWGMMLKASYMQALFPSLVSCGIFAFAHDQRGNFSILRLLGAMVVGFLIMTRMGDLIGGSFFLAGGLLGYILLSLCGWAGIGIGRSLRGPEQLQKEKDEEEKSIAVAAAIVEGDKVEAPFSLGNSPFDQIMAVTHGVWGEGKLEHISKAFKKEATSNSLAKYIKIYEKYKEEIIAAAGIRPFDEDEYMVSFVTKGFLMTSKAIYLLKGKSELIMIKDIAQYDSKSGWTATMFITLKNGQKLEFPKMEYVPADAAVKALISG